MIKTLARSLRQYKKQSIITPLLVGGEVIMEIIIPLIMASLIDYGIELGEMNNIWRYSIYLLCLVAVQLVLGIMGAKTGVFAAAGFASNLRSDMYTKMQQFSFANIDKFSTASIITRLTTDVTNVQFSYQMIIRLVFRAPLMMAFALIVSFSINVQIAMTFLAFLPFLAIGLGIIIKVAYPIFEKVFESYDELNNVVQENVRGIRVVKSFDRAEYEEQKFAKMSATIYRYFSKAEKILTANYPIMQITAYSYIIIISWVGAKAIIASGNNIAFGLTTGQLMSLFIYAQQILISLMVISMIFVIIAISRASVKRISEVLKEESSIVNCENPVYEVKNGQIIFQGVDFVYGADADKKVLNNINVTIESGETVGILGATGSAKSSLVQLIPRIYDVTAGSVLVGGGDVREYDIEALRTSVALVLQKNELFSGTVKENLLWGNRNATQEEIAHACYLAKADDFIKTMSEGYDSHIEQGGANISGGQKQRLCIARALLKKPQILIFDDSTSAVDTNTDAFIQRNLAQFMPDTTKITISQRVSSVQHADKILIMDDGKIMDMGKHDELLKRCNIYKELYESQQKKEHEDE